MQSLVYSKMTVFSSASSVKASGCCLLFVPPEAGGTPGSTPGEEEGMHVAL